MAKPTNWWKKHHNTIKTVLEEIYLVRTEEIAPGCHKIERYCPEYSTEEVIFHDGDLKKFYVWLIEMEELKTKEA